MHGTRHRCHRGPVARNEGDIHVEPFVDRVGLRGDTHFDTPAILLDAYMNAAQLAR
jgi:hypothetical protein